MCGIFGVIAKKESLNSKSLLNKTIERIALLSESWGKDSYGEDDLYVHSCKSAFKI